MALTWGDASGFIGYLKFERVNAIMIDMTTPQTTKRLEIVLLTLILVLLVANMAAVTGMISLH
jgi:hypothetical protein